MFFARILAGAPLANTTQEGVVEPGAVFRCPVTEDRYQEVPIDSTGNEAQWDGRQFRQIEEKSRQRLGASIYSVGTAGMFVVRTYSVGTAGMFVVRTYSVGTAAGTRVA